jgi:nicotinamidase-related amidase
MITSLPKRDEPFRVGETALLLVDMQRIWLEPGADPSHPERGPYHYFYRETASRTIPNQERLVAAARANGVEVMHTIIQSLTEDGRDRSLDQKLTPIHIAPSRPEGLPVPSLMPVGTRSCCRRPHRASSTRPTSTTC